MARLQKTNKGQYRNALERHYQDNPLRKNECMMCGKITYNILGNDIACGRVIIRLPITIL